MINPDAINYLRLANIFSPQATPGDTSQAPDITQTPTTSDLTDDAMMNQQIAQMFHPSNMAQTQLTNMMNQMPQRSQFPVSTGQKILAGIAGLGAGGPVGIAGGQPIGYRMNPEGFGIQQQLMNQPYNKAIEDWSLKLKPLQELAGTERAANTNERLVAGQLLTQQRADRKQSEVERQDKVKNEQQQQKIDIAANRAKAYEFKQTHPNYKSFTDDKGMLVFVNQADPTDIVKTDVDTGKLDDIDKINLNLQGSLAKIAATGSQARQTENLREVNREKLQPIIQNRQQAVRQTAPATAASSVKTETPAQKQLRQFSKAQEAFNSHPEWQPYISLDKNAKRFDVKVPPSTGLGGSFGIGHAGGDSKTLDDINKFIYGNEAPAQQTNAQPQKVHVQRLSDGTTGWVTNPDMSKYKVIP